MSPNIEDTLAIHDLYARQQHAIDSGDAVGWAETFTADGSFRSPSYAAPAVGREALATFATDVADSASAAGHSLQHWIGNLTLSERDDCVSASAYLTLIAITPGEAPRLVRSVWVTDLLVRTDAGWRFRSRTVANQPAPTPTLI